MRRDYTFSAGNDIIGEHLAVIGDDVDTSIAALQEDSLQGTLNRLQRRVAQMPFAGLSIGPYRIPATQKPWDFLKDEKEYSILAKTSLAGTLSAGNPVDLADATGWETSGAFITYRERGTWDFVTFGSRSSNTLSDLGDVGIGNNSGDVAVKLYAVPDRFSEVVSLHVDGLEYKETSQNPAYRQYSIINKYLWFSPDLGSGTANLVFQTDVTDLTDVDQSMSMPSELDDFFIEMLNARAYKLNGNPRIDVDDSLQAARNHLLAFLGFAHRDTDRRIKTVRGPFRSPVG